MCVETRNIYTSIIAEREQLCSLFGISPTLTGNLILVVCRNTGESVTSMFENGNRDPLYGKAAKVLFIYIDRNYPANNLNLDFPPPKYTEFRIGEEWPKWRSDLWHEFIHEVQDRVLNQATVDHPNPLWREAVELLIANLKEAFPDIEHIQNLTFEILQDIIGGNLPY